MGTRPGAPRPNLKGRPAMLLLNCLAVGAGGFVGSVLRYLVGLIPLGASAGFPFKTLAINVAGAFAIGVICALAGRQAPLDPHLVLLLKVGVCGGFTTFSTFALEASDLIGAGQWPLAAAYAVTSVVLSIAAVFGAEALMR